MFVPSRLFRPTLYIFRRWKSGIPMLLPSPVFTNFAEPELRQRALHCGYGDKHEYKRVVVDILADMIIGPACHV